MEQGLRRFSLPPVTNTWQPNTQYAAGQLVIYLGQPWTANATFTSGAAFNASNWTLVTPGSIITSSTLSISYVLTNTYVDVPNWGSIVVPANSGAIELVVPEFICSIGTGTNAVGTIFNVEVRVLDEANSPVAYGLVKQATPLNTALTLGGCANAYGFVANNASAKTYRVQARCVQVGTAGCTANLLATNSGFPAPVLLARRT